ncbi:MAG: tetraacyldisaccharide 4'-kinase [Planctomycetota bacterium]|nr:tetraacyldisaccharide 4'-kinase [Planctomycetota bacterium]
MAPSLSRRLVSGPDDLWTLLVRVVLMPLAMVYLFIVVVKNALYDAGLLRPRSVGAAVVSVGNVTVGGTGKTPFVVLLARMGVEAGRKVGVVSTGHGAEASADGLSEEVMLLRERCPDAEIVVAPDKLPGAREAVGRGCNLIILDDALHARHLQRDMEVILVDARRPFGSGWLLPAGGLREPPSSISRADVLVLSHADAVSDDRRDEVVHRLRTYNRGASLLEVRHVPLGWRSVAGGELIPPESLAGREVFAFCGIAAPEGFRHTLESLGARVTGLSAFSDHHAFETADLAKVRAEAGTSLLICTEKDARKIGRLPGNEDVACLLIDVVLEGDFPPLPEVTAATVGVQAEAH